MHPRRRRLNILTQITVPYIILAIVIVGGGTFLLTRVVEGSVEERFTNQLVDTARLAKESLVRKEDEMLEALRLVSFMQGIDLALETGSSTSLSELALPVAFNAQVEAIAFVRRNGQTLLTRYLDPTTLSYQPLAASVRFSQMDFVSRVLAGESDELGDKFSGRVQTETGDFIFVAGPVTNEQGTIVGAALIGRSMNTLARDLREETLGHFTFYSMDGSALLSTLPESAGLGAEQAQTVVARQDEGTFQREVQANDTTYTELLTPLELRNGEDVALMGVALANQVLQQTSNLTRNNLFLVMGGALVLVLVVGALVAGRITRPIRELRDAALRVSEGDLAAYVGQGGGDEVGVLSDSFNEMVSNLSRSRQELLDTYDKTIEGWAHALDLRDRETEGHSRRVAQMAVQLGERLRLPEDQLKLLYRGALLHDVGKFAVSDSILLKPGALTPQERLEMRKHPDYAKSMLQQIEFLKPTLDIPYSHHEKWDGTGYPQGLKGEAIPLLARIFTVVDVWDAMTSDRPYRKALSFTLALDQIRQGRGTEFDPKVVDVFLDLLGDLIKQKQTNR